MYNYVVTISKCPEAYEPFRSSDLVFESGREIRNKAVFLVLSGCAPPAYAEILSLTKADNSGWGAVQVNIHLQHSRRVRGMSVRTVLL